MIGKIAYTTAVWQYGLDAFQEVFVTPSILGRSKDITEWVGSDGLQLLRYETADMQCDHVITVWNDFKGAVFARVKLFKMSATPEYTVIVGRLVDPSLQIIKYGRPNDLLISLLLDYLKLLRRDEPNFVLLVPRPSFISNSECRI